MVVEKAARRVKESSPAERFIGGVLSAILAVMVTIGGMVYKLNREVGIYQATMNGHLNPHPDERINRDIAEIRAAVVTNDARWLAIINRMDNRIHDLEIRRPQD